MRKIAVDGQLWRYKVGKQFLIVQTELTGYRVKHLIQLWKVLGFQSPSDWEHDKRDRGRYTRVTPALVADFIRNAEWYIAVATPQDIAKYRSTLKLVDAS